MFPLFHPLLSSPFMFLFEKELRHATNKALHLLQSKSAPTITRSSAIRYGENRLECNCEEQYNWNLQRGGVSDDQIDEHAILLDDDSDLEFEVDASPDVSQKSAIEASACVKL